MQNMKYKNSDPIIRFRMVNFSASKINMMSVVISYQRDFLLLKYSENVKLSELYYII